MRTQNLLKLNHVRAYFSVLPPFFIHSPAAADIATILYPHQKKALTFLLEREREQPREDGTFSSLWQRKINSMTQTPTWFHAVTQKEVFKEPIEAKGSILADDVCL
jgi:hypothetical protein